MKSNRSYTKLAGALALLSSVTLTAQTAMAAEPSHLEHPHGAGTFMIEASYMRMNMDGLRAGTTDVSKADATAMMGDYKHMMVPTTMTMDMFMLMPMYNFTKDFSVMLMLNYLNNDMKMEGMCNSSMSTSGLGDTQASFSYKFMDGQFAASMDVNVPTGSIDEKTKMKMMMMGSCMEMEMQAPYAMQLGSGTYDFTPSLTYLGGYYSWKYGAQVSYKYRTGENDNNYTLGNEANAKMWVRKPFMGVTWAGELDVKRWGAIDGKDPKISTASQNMTMMGGATTVAMLPSPTNFPANYGGTLANVDLSASIPVGMAYVLGKVSIPVYQDLNGLQMKHSTGWTVGVGAMF
ncbi:MAG: hypothetical protein R3240_01405 [Gammaproteobacteria bacterium]|nr:hypothetical protein [Gammaproteobacteria bacterium]